MVHSCIGCETYWTFAYFMVKGQQKYMYVHNELKEIYDLWYRLVTCLIRQSYAYNMYIYTSVQGIYFSISS